MAVQNGTEVVTGSAPITYYDVFSSEKDGKYRTKFTAIGSTGSEIGFVYIVGDDGTYSKTYEQATIVSDGKFVYSSSTKEITFAQGDAPLDGEYIACAYTYNTAKNAQRISINSDGIPPVVQVSAYGIARDTCTGELFPCVVEGQAQVDGNWTFDLSADGEPVVQNLAMEFVKGCVSKELYTFTVFTEDEDDGAPINQPSLPISFEVPTTGEVYGQQASTFGSNLAITSQGKVTGTVEYIENFTVFPESANSGYFLPFNTIVPDGVKTTTVLKISNNGSIATGGDIASPNAVRLGATEADAKAADTKLIIDFDGDGNTYSPTTITLDVSELIYTPKA